MDILSYVMGQKSVNASSGGGGSVDPNIVSFRKQIIAPEQTVTIAEGAEYPSLLELSDDLGEASIYQKMRRAILTVNGKDFYLFYANLNTGGDELEWTDIVDGEKYYWVGCSFEELYFNAFNTSDDLPAAGDYSVSISELVPVTE